MPSNIDPFTRELSRPSYEDAFPAHDIFHAKRVHDIALRLATQHPDSVDQDVLAAAAWVHDIGRPLEHVGKIDNHGDWAADEATTLLAAESVSSGRIAAVEPCLRTHSIRASSPDPDTTEAQLLFDADKLDATSAAGLVRLACIVGERSGRIGEPYAIIDDTATLTDDAPELPDVDLLHEWARERLNALYTDPSRRLGEARWDIIERFSAQFSHEIDPDTVKCEC